MIIYILISVLIVLCVFIIFLLISMQNKKSMTNSTELFQIEELKISSEKIKEDINNLSKDSVNQSHTVIEKLSEKILTQDAQIKENFYNISEKLSASLNNGFKDTSLLNQKMIEKYNKNTQDSILSLNLFKENLNEKITKDFDKLTFKVETRLKEINNVVDARLIEGFEKTNKTFENVIERLAKIDEAQKKMEELGKDVGSLQNILTDKKQRGNYGEIHLKQILENVFGENNSSLYALQQTLDATSSKPDAIIFTPEPVQKLCIDSKFPLENYNNYNNYDITSSERDKFKKIFSQDVKKHIDDISSKYIIPNETADFAIMFIPAEAIYSDLHAHFNSVIQYSHEKKVFITSPTTIIAFMNTLLVLLKDQKRQKYANEITKQLRLLSTEFERYQDRWNKLSSHIDTVAKDVKNLHVTTNKINKKFSDISNVALNSDTSEVNILEIDTSTDNI